MIPKEEQNELIWIDAFSRVAPCRAVPGRAKTGRAKNGPCRAVSIFGTESVQNRQNCLGRACSCRAVPGRAGPCQSAAVGIDFGQICNRFWIGFASILIDLWPAPGRSEDDL